MNSRNLAVVLILGFFLNSFVSSTPQNSNTNSFVSEMGGGGYGVGNNTKGERPIYAKDKCKMLFNLVQNICKLISYNFTEFQFLFVISVTGPGSTGSWGIDE